MTKKDFMKSVGSNLKKELYEHNISQSELSRMTGLSRSIISEYISGKKLPSVKNLINMCSRIGCYPHDIVKSFGYIEKGNERWNDF